MERGCYRLTTPFFVIMVMKSMQQAGSPGNQLLCGFFSLNISASLK
jgi:hypothetical protein